MIGSLYIVATPIGNLSDFSQRAVSVLQAADYLACEDTRTSATLLNHYNIDTPTFSFHQHNEHQKVSYLIELLESGLDVGLISDAGMPGISDPGFLAVREAHQAGANVSVIPGPDAATTALVASGLPCERYIYEGFVPRKKGRSTLLKNIAEEERTVIVYESCHRIERLLKEMNQLFRPQRMIAVCRELTKKFEEIVRGPVAQVTETFTQRSEQKGEFTVVIAGVDYRD